MYEAQKMGETERKHTNTFIVSVLKFCHLSRIINIITEETLLDKRVFYFLLNLD